MFALASHRIKITNVNPRAEKHGDEHVLACDIKVEATCHNSVLDEFDTGLRPLLYRKPVPGEQSELPFGDATDGLVMRRVPSLAPLNWNEDYPGYDLRIVEGMGLIEPIEISDVELTRFVFEALDGGSVRVTFRASCYPGAKEIGRLCALIQEDAELTLTPPDGVAPVQRELDEAA